MKTVLKYLAVIVATATITWFATWKYTMANVCISVNEPNHGLILTVFGESEYYIYQ